jgi:hypothetical protein
LLRDRSRPLKRPEDLKHHVLLHFDYAGAMPRSLALKPLAQLDI